MERIDVNKKGDQYYYIILSLIIGLIIFAIFLYWIYEEYFTEQEADLQICRQSVEIRANIPTVDTGEGPAGLDIVSGIKYLVTGDGTRYRLKDFKDEFPLKCKTQVLTIDYEDVTMLEKEVAETIAGCWNVFGEGKNDLFSAHDVFYDYFYFQSTCVPCGRIHISPKVREYYLDKKIDIQRGLKQPFRDANYLGYLTLGDGPFSAFSVGNAREFILSGDKFEVRESDLDSGVFFNRVTKKGDSGSFKEARIAQVFLPRFFDPEKGDLLVYYGAISSASDAGPGNYYPYIFYTHSRSNYLSEVDDMLVIDGTGIGTTLGIGIGDTIGFMCNRFEGIPA